MDHPETDLTTPNAESVEPTLDNPIVARASRSYRRTRYFVGTIFFATGLYFAYDGWVAWPAGNAEIARTESALEAAEESGDETTVREIEGKLEELGDRKSDADLLIQKLFFFALCPGSVLLILNALFRSRGEVRHDGKTITLPDGRSVPVNAILSIDNRRWDKKGIAVVHYQPADGKPAKFKLDDFIYDRPPIDKIHADIVTRLPSRKD